MKISTAQNSTNERILQPLIDRKVARDEAVKMIMAFAEVMQGVFEQRVAVALTDQEWQKFNEWGKSAKPDAVTSISKLEEEYEKKTGQNFMQLHEEIMMETAEVIGKTLDNVQMDLAKVAALPQSRRREVYAALQTNDSDKVLKLIQE